MPKNRGKKGSGGRVEIVNGSCLVSFTAGSAVIPCFISPSTYQGASLGDYSPKLLAMSACFQLFRFVKLLVEMNPANFVISAAGAAGLGIIGFAGDIVLGTAPTTPSGIVDLPWRTPYVGNGNTNGTGQTTVVRRGVPKSLLKCNNVSWFNTRTTSADILDLEIQGQFFCWGSTFSAVGSGTYIVEYTCEFKSFINPVNVPQKSLVPECGQQALEWKKKSDVTLGLQAHNATGAMSGATRLVIEKDDDNTRQCSSSTSTPINASRVQEHIADERDLVLVKSWQTK
jgi:hypothetical protein